MPKKTPPKGHYGHVGHIVDNVRQVVQHGVQDGRKIGFPTINLDYGHIRHIVQHGVYNARVCINRRWWPSILYCGPKIGQTEDTLEIHIPGYVGPDLYGKRVKYEVLEFIRGPMTFDTLKALQTQIKADMKVWEKWQKP